MKTFAPITSFEPIDRKTVDMIANAIGGAVPAMVAGLNEVDLKAGAGKIDGNTKCLWTKAGHRIEVFHQDGTFGAAKSKEIDPAKPS